MVSLGLKAHDIPQLDLIPDVITFSEMQSQSAILEFSGQAPAR